MNRTNYIARIDTCIAEMEYRPLNRDPNNTVQKKNTALIKTGCQTSRMKSKLNVIRIPTTPRLFRTLKGHKNSYPLRSIVAKQAQTYFVEKAFVPFLGFFQQFDVDFYFINRNKDLKLSKDSTSASLDITSLYPSIDVDEAKMCIYDSIESKQSLN